jgi:MYXO-CTERM domain-containing protein
MSFLLGRDAHRERNKRSAFGSGALPALLLTHSKQRAARFLTSPRVARFTRDRRRVDTRPMLRTILVVTLLAVVASHARAQPETRGSHTFTTWSAGTVTLAGAAIPVMAYYPTDGGGPFPVVAVVHGASRNMTYMAEMARTFASRGFVALTPSMPCTVFSCNHAANAMQVRALLEWGVAQSADSTTPIAGLVDGSRRGVVGHSWGGLAVFLAAEGHPEIQAVVTLDPNDDTGIAAAAAPMVTQPQAHVMAQVMGTCNATNWKDTVFPNTPSPHMRVMVTGAGHCDVEDPTDALCPTLCTAGAGSTVTPYFRRYAVAFMGCMLQADTSMAPWIGGTQLSADMSANIVQDVSTAGLDTLPCNGGTLPDAGPRPDAGVLANDAARLDAGGGGNDATTTRDVGAAIDGGSSVVSSSGGCACRAGGSTSPGLAFTTVLALVVAARRRRLG